jgi:glucokinase
MATRYAIGVDVGGTKIVSGVVDCDSGQVVSSAKLASPMQGADALVAAIQQCIAQARAAAPAEVGAAIRSIGVGLAGQVDVPNGILRAGPNLAGGVTNVPMTAPLTQQFGLPIVLGNDVQVAAIGEGMFGSGRGVDLFACVFVGTGIGGALMVSGQRYAGASNTAGEIGHIMVKAGGRLCGCGQLGHLEAYASRTAMVTYMRKQIEEKGRKSVLADALLDTSQRVRSKQLADALAQRDPLVVEALTEGGYYLGLGLVSLVNLWNPRRIVIGGGVVDRIDLLFNLAAQEVKKGALSVPAATVEVVKSSLGDFSGVIGAAVMASATS